jgi:hypothetical protein
MEVFMKNGVEVAMPPTNKETRVNMERCAEFLARMIQKYGKEVSAEIVEEKK